MSPELITAVKERIRLGYAKEAIYAELVQAGYTEDVLAEVWTVAMAGQDSVEPPVSQSSAVHTGVIPGSMTLLSNSLSFIRDRFDLLLILAAPNAVLIILGGSTGVLNEDGGSDSISFFIGSLLASIVYILLSFAVLYIVSKSPQREVSLSESLTWTKQNILGIIWVSLLMFFVILGGYMLFIVPGIILSLILFFSQYVYINEGTKGVAALLRSRDLAKGKWWSIAIKIALISLVLIVVFIIASFTIGLMLGLSMSPAVSIPLLAIIYQAFSVAGSIIMFHVAMQMYRILSAALPPTSSEENKKGRKSYVALAILGLAAPILIILFAVILGSLQEAKQSGLGSMEQLQEQVSPLDKIQGPDEVSVSNIDYVRQVAEDYYQTDDENSYEGVCARLSQVPMGSNIVCNDEVSGWALRYDIGSLHGCVDSNTSADTGTLSEGSIACTFELDTKARANELRNINVLE
jgi:hypothetical protein